MKSFFPQCSFVFAVFVMCAGFGSCACGSEIVYTITERDSGPEDGADSDTDTDNDSDSNAEEGVDLGIISAEIIDPAADDYGSFPSGQVIMNLTLEIFNFDSAYVFAAGTPIPLKMNVGPNQWGQETASVFDLEPETSIETFCNINPIGSLSFPEPGEYEFCISTAISDDPNPSNDEFCDTISVQ